MRYFIVTTREFVGPFVLAEAVDETWAEDVQVLNRCAILTEDELRLDPDLAPALAAWEAKDDSTHAAFLAVTDAEKSIDSARIEAIVAGEIPNDDSLEAINEETESALFPDDVLRYYKSSAELWRSVFELVKTDGEDAAAQVARMIARDLVGFAEWRGPRVI